MHHLDLSLPTPAGNLACDEVLLELGEEEGREVLRFWESAVSFVVLGYGNRAAAEANLAACRQRGIPVLRRLSGGGAVLQGPGCLNYSLILRVEPEGPTAGIAGTNRHVMQRHAAALRSALGVPVQWRGDTDLAVHERKFSGNAQRRGRRALLFHGTFLLGVDVELLEAVLPFPSRSPEYRGGRSHRAFVAPLRVEAAVLKEALRRAWGVREALAPPCADRIEGLVERKYGREEWNFRF